MLKLTCLLLALLAFPQNVFAARLTDRTPEWAKWYPADGLVQPNALRKFHIDSIHGDDARSGDTPDAAWKTLNRLKAVKLLPGDHILLRRGSRFNEALELTEAVGSPEAFIRVLAFGPETEARPVIDGKSHLAAVNVTNSRCLQIEDLEIVNDNSRPVPPPKDLPARLPKEQNGAKKITNYGVLITAKAEGVTRDIYLKRLKIHTIFPAKSSSSEGRLSQTYYGYGVTIENNKDSAGTVQRIAVTDCQIENTGHFGILTSAPGDNRVKDVVIWNNRTQQTGGSALLAANVENCHVYGNVFDRSGAFDDARKHGRGSGSWTFNAQNVLYEKNVSMNSKGKGDSAGIHIDFNCRDVVVQRNLSYNNEGGFMEVLGNNYNCAYRYNVSINDGARVKGVDGASQEGKTLMVSGHCMKAPFGPFNSYFYNNTVYADEAISPKFAITGSAEGLLIVNNIFHLSKSAKAVADDQPSATKGREPSAAKAKNVIFKNNIYPSKSTLPPTIGIDTGMIIADPQYTNPGGKLPADYIPRNKAVIQDKGIVVEKLPGDDVGIQGGLLQDYDFFGNPIIGKPDIGAIEIY